MKIHSPLITIDTSEQDISPAFSRELSWLQFNARVLQEADDPSVPLIERLRFLGIYSSNMDEFYRVRVPALTRFLKTILHAKGREAKQTAQSLLDHIHEVTVKQQAELERIFITLQALLAAEGVSFHQTLTTLEGRQQAIVTRYFREEVGPALMPIWLKSRQPLPMLRDRAIYFAVELHVRRSKEPLYALLRIPTHVLPRFFVLPCSTAPHQAILFLDEIIRLHLSEVFRGIDTTSIHAYALKVTRDSELALEEERDIAHSYTQQIEKSLKKRKYGTVTRLVYDATMPKHLLDRIRHGVGVHEGMRIIPGGRYHNFRDLIGFPNLGRPEWLNPILPAVPHPRLEGAQSLLSVIQRQDVLLNFPYQRFSYVIEVLREAALDPSVHSIKITLYRMADASHVVNALRSAIYNGKRVLAVVELQARFDEENNLYWAKKLQEEGVEVVFGVPGLKVHSKLFLIERGKGKNACSIAYVGTGNFNENTARTYTDCALLTADHRITREVHELFDFLQVNYHIGAFHHLIVAPFSMRHRLIEMIDHEIYHAQQGGVARIDLKLNNLNDEKLVNKLYEASRAGVQLRLIVRSVCSLVSGLPGLSEHIQTISIVDRYLEHSRLLILWNGGHTNVYLSSADWMVRNLDHRVEVACPIYDKAMQAQLKLIFELLWQDTQKARLIDANQSNPYRTVPTGEPRLRGQTVIYEVFRTESEGWS
jgi:polyphosphate kinase